MFTRFPEILRENGIPADVRTNLLLQRSISRGLVQTFGDLYMVLKGIVVKHPSQMGPFTKAYYKYFLNIDIANGETLEDAIKRSHTFKEWLEHLKENYPDLDIKDMDELVQRFLDENHLTSFDIKQIIDGEELLKQDDPSQPDDGGEASIEKELDTIADYSQMDIEELLRRMKEVAKQQKGKHSGGSHWIGTGGISPYGHGGAAKGGVRVGGTGGGKMARAVFNDARYFPVDRDKRLNDDNIDAALASLKGVLEETAESKLDVPTTISSGLKRGGLFIPELKEEKQEKMQIILMIDNGGFSMDPYIGQVQQLFRKMKTRFAHDLKVYYFHNTIYNRIYTDPRRSKYISMDRFLQHDPAYTVFIVGDAAMAPWELDENSVINWGRIKEKYKKTCWLNPEPVNQWRYTMTTSYLAKIVPMFSLTPAGVEKAVLYLNQQKRNIR